MKLSNAIPQLSREEETEQGYTDMYAMLHKASDNGAGASVASAINAINDAVSSYVKSRNKGE